jgi:hypothetical protein
MRRLEVTSLAGFRERSCRFDAGLVGASYINDIVSEYSGVKTVVVIVVGFCVNL